MKGQLSGGVLTTLTEALGTNQDNTRTAVNAAVPTLLAALGSAASSRVGARNIQSTLDSFDERVVHDIPQFLSGGGKSLLDIGTSLLGSVFGSGTLLGLSSALRSFAGLDSAKTPSLLGLLTLIMLGTLKSRTQDMGADGLTRLFEGQKQNIANTMPSGLSNTLAGVSGMREATEWVRGAIGSTYEAGRAVVSETAGVTRASAAAGASTLRWALPVLALFIVVGLLWWELGGRSTTPVTALSIGTDRMALLSRQVTDFYRSATDTFSEIKDTASAEAAIPKLRDLSTTLDSLRSSMDQLPADARPKTLRRCSTKSSSTCASS
jgi:hypothetical protein